MPVVHDDLGVAVNRPDQVLRVVSLVPSLTESICSVDPSLLVGATQWCTHPADLDVERVRGTKNPDIKAIVRLKPDLVIANMEENREIDVRRLREAGLSVWVTRIETVAQSLTSITRLMREGLDRDAPEWCAKAAEVWSQSPPDLGLRVAVPVWRDPWFVVGPRTFAGDVLARCGFTNAFADAQERYPKVPVESITGVDLVLLPDEPYVFTPQDGPDAFTVRTALIPGRSLTWYGPTLLTARDDIVVPALEAMRP